MIFIDILLVGSKEKKNIATHGSSFLVKYDKKGTFVVTCKHVIKEANRNSPESIFVSRPITQNNLDPIAFLEKIYYHPDDAEGKSYDIAVSKIDNEIVIDKNIKRVLFSLEETLENFLLKKSRIFAIGYPVEYINSVRRDSVQLKSLSPEYTELHNPFYSSNLQQVKHVDFDEIYKEAYFAEAKKVLGKGASGGLVYSISNSSIIPLGMVLGHYTEQESGKKYQFFASFKRILEVIECFKK